MNEHEALEAIRRWDLTGIEREIVDMCERLLARIEELEELEDKDTAVRFAVDEARINELEMWRGSRPVAAWR